MTNLLTPLASNQDLTAAFFNTTIDNMRSVKFLTADLTANNTALGVYTPELALHAEILAKYVFNSCLFYDSTSATDFKITFAVPSGTILASFWNSGTGITTGTNSLDMSAQSVSDAVGKSIGAVAQGTILCVRLAGYIETSTISGDCSIGYAQDTPAPTNSYLRQGSWLSMTRVG